MTDQAQECYANAAFARRLEEQFPDQTAWSCVVRFYAALHLVNAYLIDKHNVRLDPKTAAHLERKRAMERCPELRDAPHKFRQLKDMSERVRYDATFDYTPEFHRQSVGFFEKIGAIIEPKLRK
jgi:hypothetical protein